MKTCEDVAVSDINMSLLAVFHSELLPADAAIMSSYSHGPLAQACIDSADVTTDVDFNELTLMLCKPCTSALQ